MTFRTSKNQFVRVSSSTHSLKEGQYLHQGWKNTSFHSGITLMLLSASQAYCVRRIESSHHQATSELNIWTTHINNCSTVFAVLHQGLQQVEIVVIDYFMGKRGIQKEPKFLLHRQNSPSNYYSTEKMWCTIYHPQCVSRLNLFCLVQQCHLNDDEL